MKDESLSDGMTVALAALGAMSLIVILLIIEPMISGYVLCVLWGWFCVPAFGLAPLGLAQGVGIALIINFLTHKIIPKSGKDSTKETIQRVIAILVVKPGLTLFIGWVAHLFL